MTTNDLLLLMQRRDLLHGWVDMHTHPLALYLGFNPKLLHGGNDIGSLLPTDSQCRNHVRASDMGHALGPDNPTHGGWDALKNLCGDDIRQQVINNVQKENKAVQTPFMARGAPDFRDWPKWNDITHQKMWGRLDSKSTLGWSACNGSARRPQPDISRGCRRSRRRSHGR